MPMPSAPALLFLIAQGLTAGADELSDNRLLAPEHLIQVEIEMAPDDWTALCRQSRDFRTAFTNPSAKPFTYYQGSLSIDGVKIESVGVRKKGFIGSLDDRWPSLKIKFDEYVDQHPVKGLEGLTLNNNKQDPSLVSQFLSYRLFNAAGVHAPRSNFARVTVNGEYLGIYSNVETIGKPFLKERFGNSSGNLYEGTLADFYPAALDNLEVKGNSRDSDRGNVMRLAELLTSNNELSLDEVEPFVDIDNFIKFWAVESLIGFWDGYSNNQNNYWIYENRKNGKLYFMPWGADMAFMGVRGPFGFGVQGSMSVYAEAMLANRLYNTRGVSDRYRQTMLAVLDGVWNEDELIAAIDRVEALVAGHLHNRQLNAPRAMESVRRFIRSRRETIVKEFETWPAKVATQPRKPMYTVEVGEAKGTFTTTWRDKPTDNPREIGDADVRLRLGEAAVTFKQLEVNAQPAQMPRFPFGGPNPPPDQGQRAPGAAPNGRPGQPDGGPGTAPFAGPFGQMEPPATIVFSGERTSDSKKLTLTLSVDRATFAASAGKTIPVQGTFSEGDARPSLFNPLGGRSIVGEIKLSKAGISAGDPVVGEFDVKIAETHGGFMTRVAPPRQRPGRPDGGPGAPGPGAPGGFPPGPFGGPGLGPVTNVALLGMGEVQKELELTDNQREQVAAVQRDLRDRMRAAMSGINFQEIFDLSEDERMEQFETIRKKTEQANVEAEGKLDKILNAMHQGRLSQLRLQREGVEAFSRPDVIKSLALSDAQQEKIRGIQQVSRPQPGFGPPDFARIEEQRRKALEDALAILAHEQKMQWSEMTGREFKFPLPQPGFGFGDPGGFGPGN